MAKKKKRGKKTLVLHINITKDSRSDWRKSYLRSSPNHWHYWTFECSQNGLDFHPMPLNIMKCQFLKEVHVTKLLTFPKILDNLTNHHRDAWYDFHYNSGHGTEKLCFDPTNMEVWWCIRNGRQMTTSTKFEKKYQCND